MLGIDPHIVEHEIKTYPDARSIRQSLRAMNPRKALAIKEEIEKLLKYYFIYPTPLTEWVSNPIPVDKKQGAIRICTDFHDLNRSRLKDNFPTPLLIKFCMSVQEVRFSILWMDFSDIIRYILNLRTNIILHLFVLGECSHIKKCLSALKTSELHFSGQWPWSSTISSQLLKYFWMNSPLILIWECVIPITWYWYSKDAYTIQLD